MRRSTIAAEICSAMAVLVASKVLKSVLLRMKISHSVMVRALALRGTSETRAISPKNPPSVIVARLLGRSPSVSGSLKMSTWPFLIM